MLFPPTQSRCYPFIWHQNMGFISMRSICAMTKNGDALHDINISTLVIVEARTIKLQFAKPWYAQWSTETLFLSLAAIVEMTELKQSGTNHISNDHIKYVDSPRFCSVDFLQACVNSCLTFCDLPEVLYRSHPISSANHLKQMG